MFKKIVKVVKPKAPVVPEAKPEIKPEPKLGPSCECGRPAQPGSHQCWPCAHRA